jgi:hypothetical protein
MPTGEYYLQQACSCFDMATMSREVSVRQRWIDRANEYLILADALGDDPLPELPLTGGNEQVQPMQQQQQQAKDDDKS